MSHVFMQVSGGHKAQCCPNYRLALQFVERILWQRKAIILAYRKSIQSPRPSMEALTWQSLFTRKQPRDNEARWKYEVTNAVLSPV